MQFDIFLSYSGRLHRHAAIGLHQVLLEHGYRVWFDLEVLGRKDAWRPPDYLQTAREIEEGIQDSRCTVLFAMQAQLERPGYPYPTILPDDLKRYLNLGKHEDATAFSWQYLEFALSSQCVVIHDGSYVAYDDKGRGETHLSLEAALNSCGIPSPHSSKVGATPTVDPGEPGENSGDFPVEIVESVFELPEFREHLIERELRRLVILQRKMNDGYWFHVLYVCGPPGTGKKNALRLSALQALKSGLFRRVVFVDPPSWKAAAACLTYLSDLALQHDETLFILNDIDAFITGSHASEQDLERFFRDLSKTTACVAMTGSIPRQDRSLYSRMSFLRVTREADTAESLRHHARKVTDGKTLIREPDAAVMRDVPMSTMEVFCWVVTEIPIYPTGRPESFDLSDAPFQNRDALWSLVHAFHQSDVAQGGEVTGRVQAVRFLLDHLSVHPFFIAMLSNFHEREESFLNLFFDRLTRLLNEHPDVILEDAVAIRAQLKRRVLSPYTLDDNRPFLHLTAPRQRVEAVHDFRRAYAKAFFRGDFEYHFDESARRLEAFEGARALELFAQRMLLRWPFWILSVDEAGLPEGCLTQTLRLVREHERYEYREFGVHLHPIELTVRANPWRYAALVELV